MDSPSLDSPRAPTLFNRHAEAGEAPRTVDQTGKATRRDVVLIASFGSALAVDYAAFVSRSARSTATAAWS